MQNKEFLLSVINRIAVGAEEKDNNWGYNWLCCDYFFRCFILFFIFKTGW